LNQNIKAVRGSDSYFRNCWLYKIKGKVKVKVKVKIKQSLHMPGQALRVPEFKSLRFDDFQQINVFISPALSTIRLYPIKEIFLLFISVIGWVEIRIILRPEKLRQWKFPVTSSWTQTATFRLVGQCIKYPRYCVTDCTRGSCLFTIKYTLPSSHWPAISLWVTLDVCRSYPNITHF